MASNPKVHPKKSHTETTITADAVNATKTLTTELGFQATDFSMVSTSSRSALASLGDISM
ncbi:hypothetical protein [Corynebacterium alimapuense]|uniref:hypothetical protein n=1 Tax=Corynebacterium alimapuense TaxID=1576874 RepID=UPI000F806A3A|nr:hypothetical protein [Corynebacterium alimapuense]